VPAAGAFLWTSDKLFATAIGGGITTAEITAPGGASIAGIRGVAVIGSDAFDLDPAPDGVEPHLVAAALVYTASAVYLVDLDLSGGVTASTADVIAPGGGPLTDTRGITIAAQAIGGPVPVPLVLGAAFVTSPNAVRLVTRTPPSR